MYGHVRVAHVYSTYYSTDGNDHEKSNDDTVYLY